MDTNVNGLGIKNNKSFKVSFVLIVSVVALAFSVSYNFLFSAPSNNYRNEDIIIHISSNNSLNYIASKLKQEKLIKSKFLLIFFVFVFNSDKKINEGDYLLKVNDPVFVIAKHLTTGEHNISPLRITLREGLTNEEMANILAKKLPNFQKDLFLKETINKQGYLFPDTYFFYKLDSTNEVLNELIFNFNNRIHQFNRSVKKGGKSLSSIITMASIIEKEASGKSDASIISGILWKRIKLGIPLQVDADKSTYKKKGLPVSPISNPGLISIKASIFPMKSSYLYYLHDRNGIVHFAKTFTEHKQNISRYLR